jgi:hypothetical protein
MKNDETELCPVRELILQSSFLILPFALNRQFLFLLNLPAFVHDPGD